jgi:hypothetical protein
MNDPDWELKERRIAWESITKSLAEVQAALINSKMVKFTSLTEAMADLNMSRQVEFAAFLNISSEGMSSGGEEKPTVMKKESKEKPMQDWKYFCTECKQGVSEKVKNYSETNFGLCLCFKCQDKARSKIEDAVGPRDVQK